MFDSILQQYSAITIEAHANTDSFLIKIQTVDAS